jgi:small subunit ribosomal protein S5
MDTQTPKTTTKPSYTPSKGRGNFSGGANSSRGGDRKPRANFERPKPEFDQKMVSIRRVTRVVSGGRRMSFAVALAIGDKKGSLGLGTGKGNDTALAIAKALRVAKKNMFRIKTTKEMSIPVDVFAKFASSQVSIMPNRGKGLVAGSTVREMLTLAGIKNVTAKINSGSKNKLNNARATYYALYEIRTKGPAKKPVLVDEVEK